MADSVGDGMGELPPEALDAMERTRILVRAMRARVVLAGVLGVSLEELSVCVPDELPSEDELPF